MKRFAVFIVAIVLLSLHAAGQISNIQRLRIGDTVPDIELANMLRYKNANANLSDFKGRLVILDFWASWCGNCISLFPHMDSLQKKFGDKIQIVLVNTKSRESHDDAPKIMRVLNNMEKRSGIQLSLPVSYDCPELDAYFPSKFLPHEVWLDGNRKIIAITSAMEVTGENIAAFLENKKVILHTKEDALDFDPDQPLFVNGNGGKSDDFFGRSIITGYKEGLYGNAIRTSTQDQCKVTGMTVMNSTLPGLLQIAYAGTGKMDYANNRRVVEIKDKNLFEEHDDTSIYRFGYCYDLSIPPTSIQHARRYMQQDLARYFPIELKEEKRKLLCYIVRSKANATFPVSNTKEEDLNYLPESVNKYLHNIKAADLFNFFDSRMDRPLINETRIPGSQRLHIDLPFNLRDQQGLASALEKAGFTLTLEERELQVLVVKDAD